VQHTGDHRAPDELRRHLPPKSRTDNRVDISRA
jgi:hypothetical protein